LSGSYKTTSKETKLAALARANNIRKTPEANTALGKTNKDKTPSCLIDSLYEYISLCNPGTVDEAQTISTIDVKQFKPPTAVWGMAPTRDEDSDQSEAAEDSFTTDAFGKSTAKVSCDESVEMSLKDSQRFTANAVRNNPQQESGKAVPLERMSTPQTMKAHPQGDIMKNLSYPPVKVSSRTNTSDHNSDTGVSKSDQYSAVFGGPVKDDDSAGTAGTAGFAVLYSGIMKNLKKGKGKISKRKGKDREAAAVDNVSSDKTKESTSKSSTRNLDESGGSGGGRSATVGFSATEDIKKSEESKLPPALSTMRSWSFGKKKSRSNDCSREDSFEGMNSQEKVELKKSRSTPLGFLSLKSRKDLKEPIEPKEVIKPNPPPVHKETKPKLTWKSADDAKSGRTYYYNTQTKETRWTKPEMFDEDMKKYIESKKKYLESKRKYLAYKKEKADVSNSLARDSDENAPFDEAAPFDEPMGIRSSNSFESEASNVLFLNGGGSKKKLTLSNCRTQSTLTESSVGVQSRAVSMLTERTERIDNTGGRAGGRAAVKNTPDYSGDSDSGSSISSVDSNVSEKKQKNKQQEAKSKYLPLKKGNVLRKPPTHDPPIHERRRELEAEELTGVKHGLRARKNVHTRPLGASRSDQNGGEAKGARESRRTSSDSRDNTASTPEDSLSTMSDRDDDFQNRTGEKRAGRSSPATPSNQNPNEWTQTEIDKFISTSDWNSVAEYIAHVRKEPPGESKKNGKKQVRISSDAKRSSQRKYAARSRAQHDEDDSNSSSESESYDSSYDCSTDDSSYRNTKKKEVARKTRKTNSGKNRSSNKGSIAQQWFEGSLF
jgi:hypothetical protein